MQMASTPSSALRSIMAFMPGMSVSAPSSPKRLAAAYLAARNFSNCSLQARRSRMCSFLSLVYSSCSCL